MQTKVDEAKRPSASVANVASGNDDTTPTWKRIARRMFPVVGAVLAPPTYASAAWLKFIRRAEVRRFPLLKEIFFHVGIFPIRDHFHEPLFNPGHLRHSLRDVRDLPGVDLNVAEQLEWLGRFKYCDELEVLPFAGDAEAHEFYYDNVMFPPGDSEYLYNVVRLKKPRRIIEVGCGASTLMIRKALERNAQEDASYACDHLCIEPYAQPWLESVGCNVVRSVVETVDKSVFQRLDRNDILFIDTSHIVRPQGDVLFLYQEVLPVLPAGVLVHIHDIFTPRDYPDEWLCFDIRLWTEQYAVELLLASNPSFKIFGALNYLKHAHWQALSAACPIVQRAHEPSSLWIRRT